VAFDIRIPRPSVVNASASNPNFRDLSQYVLSFNTDKGMEMGNAGTFTITLVPQPDPDKDAGDNMPTGVSVDNWDTFLMGQIRMMDAFIIGMWGASPVNGAYEQNDIMFGFVDNVFKAKTTAGDSVQRSIVIRGRDATKLFQIDNIVMAPELALNEELLEAFDGDTARLEFLKFIRGLTADGSSVFLNSFIPKAIYWVLTNIPAVRLDIAMYEKAKKIHELFLTSISARAEDKIYDTSLSSYAGSVAGYFGQLIDELFYELWVDTMPGNSPLNGEKITKPILICRPKPYDRTYEVDSDASRIPRQGVQLHYLPDSRLAGNGVEELHLPVWDFLVSPIYGTDTVIAEEDILENATGRNDQEVFSFYTCLGDKDLAAQSYAGKWGYYFPLLDTELMKVFGLRAMEGTSRMLPYVWNDPISEKISEYEETTWHKEWVLQELLELLDSADITTYEEAIQIVERGERGRVNQKDVVKILTIAKRDRLWRWNRYNHLLWSGMLRLKGQIINVGSKITGPSMPYTTSRGSDREITRYDGGMTFYGVRVQHAYAFGEGWYTTVAVNRGANEQHIKWEHDRRQFDKGAAGKLNGIFTSAGGIL